MESNKDEKMKFKKSWKVIIRNKLDYLYEYVLVEHDYPLSFINEYDRYIMFILKDGEIWHGLGSHPGPEGVPRLSTYTTISEFFNDRYF